MNKTVLLAGSGNQALSEAVARSLGLPLGKVLLDRFPDAELRVEVIANVEACDTYVLQSVRPPAEYYLLELMLLADAARRAGARSLKAAIPYFAYARQDQRVTGKEPLSAQVVAAMMEQVGFDELFAVDLHNPCIEAAFRIPVQHLSAVAVLAGALRSSDLTRAVVVSPDLGGVKRAEAYAKVLNLPLAIVAKSRLSGTEVSARALVGEVRGRTPIIVDDMISTGGTLEAAAKMLRAAGCAPEITVAATHGLFVADAADRLQKLGLRRVVTTDSLPLPHAFPLNVERVSLGASLAQAIRRSRAYEPASPPAEEARSRASR